MSHTASRAVALSRNWMSLQPSLPGFLLFAAVFWFGTRRAILSYKFVYHQKFKRQVKIDSAIIEIGVQYKNALKMMNKFNFQSVARRTGKTKKCMFAVI